MESVWLAICIGMLVLGAASAALVRTATAKHIAERIGFGDMSEWKK